ncbi:outer membrane protein [Granulicella tundricola]|uniref:Outer membrane protein beta-barrel domain-containing protein n=1 Tax=Granulicella tundricola (strain ATCC BAA-1859 / DSM 23138 / MP5ACTX9) TaxID=1198114 RepID=E8WZG9_GRATM|nr:hypothetical protein [Granulicella tundricola]ADW68857.1 hypothetical protein AciX9_1809 [Granulicella tundricola MP5ACTX9]
MHSIKLARVAASMAAVALFAAPALRAQARFAQTAPATWDIFGGYSALLPTGSNNNGINAKGFDVSISQRPYTSARWIGGTIEGSGSYLPSTVTTSGLNTIKTTASYYTLLGGPSVLLPARHIRPFARILFGTVIARSSTTVNGFTTSTRPATFAYSVGGGLDVPITHLFSLRAQADWLQFHNQDTSSTDKIRTSAGLAARF